MFQNGYCPLNSKVFQLFEELSTIKLYIKNYQYFHFSMNVIDTIYTVNIHWSDDIDSTFKAESFLKFEKLIKVELELATKKEIDKIRVLNY